MFRISLLVLVCFVRLDVLGQSQALTRPFKYLKPTLTTDSEIDSRKSPYLWTVTVDRENVDLYNDKRLKNLSDERPKFMDQYIVADETEEAVLLFHDPNIDSIDFSSDAREIGWIKKENALLWDRFLWGSGKTRLIALSSWEMIESSESAILPNKFVDQPEGSARYYIFNVVKEDKASNDVLISLRTFNHRTPGLFAWVEADKLMFLDKRNGLIPNRDRITLGANLSPTIYNTVLGLSTADRNDVEYFIDNLRTDEGFIITATSGDNRQVDWIENGQFQSGFISNDEIGLEKEAFRKGLLVNRQELSVIKKAVELLSESATKEDMANRWVILFDYYNMPIFKGIGLLSLFEELVQIDFGQDLETDGTTLENLPFISEDDFQVLKKGLEESLFRLIEAESDSDYPYNFAPFSYPHYWIPLSILPLEALSEEFNNYADVKVLRRTEEWSYSTRPSEYANFDLFYVENSHNYGSNFDLKDQTIKRFYRSAARIRSNNAERGSFIFFSNTQNPITGSGEGFSENIAGIMREGVSSKPNRFFDKKALRSQLYAKNIQKIDNLRIHFFVGDNFYREALNSNRWLLEEFVEEVHYELNSNLTEVVLYSLSSIVEPNQFIELVSQTSGESTISYKVANLSR